MSSSGGTCYKDFDLPFSYVNAAGMLKYCPRGVTPSLLSLDTESAVAEMLVKVICSDETCDADTLEVIKTHVPVVILADGSMHGPIYQSPEFPLKPRKLCASFFSRAMNGEELCCLGEDAPGSTHIDSGLRVRFKLLEEEPDDFDVGFTLVDNRTKKWFVVPSGVTPELCGMDTPKMLQHLEDACGGRKGATERWRGLAEGATPKIMLRRFGGYQKMAVDVHAPLKLHKLRKNMEFLSAIRTQELGTRNPEALKSQLRVVFFTPGDPEVFTDQPRGPINYGFTVLNCETQEWVYEPVGLDTEALSVPTEEQLVRYLLDKVTDRQPWMEHTLGARVCLVSHEHKHRVLKRPSVPLKFRKLGRHMKGDFRVDDIYYEGGPTRTMHSQDSGLWISLGSAWKDPILKETKDVSTDLAPDTSV